MIKLKKNKVIKEEKYMDMCRKKIRGFTLIEIMIVIGIMVVLMSVLVPSLQRARSQAKLAVCIETIKNTATAIETYSVERKNEVPPNNLSALVPEYLKVVPTEQICNKPYDYEVAPAPDRNFTISCPGRNHGELGIPINHPLYTPATGQEEGIRI
jgi:prepilin-type N-terminal cleavage/methylation domain-containing protein